MEHIDKYFQNITPLFKQSIRKWFALIISLLLWFSLQAQNCAPATAFAFLDVNAVKARINNGGDMWWDLDSHAEYFVPKSGNVSAMFAGGLWIGGVDAQGTLHMAAQTYRQNGNDFFPGPLDASAATNNQTCSNFDRIWKVNKTTIDSFIAGLFTSPPPSIAEWPGRGNPNLSFSTNQNLAPFIDTDGDELYNPSNGDYPAIPGDQALWYVFNDAGNIHSESGGEKLGVEVQVLAYAYLGEGTCLNTTTFYHYRIENKSPNDYLAFYTGLWSDPDLGCYIDDYFGCDTVNNIGIVYNKDSVDGPSCNFNYPGTPPVVAVQVLKGPTGNDSTTHLMDFFMLYTNDFSVYGNPEEADDYHNYLKSVYKNDTHLKNPLTNEFTDYAFPSDPTDISGWSMCAQNTAPTDLRMIVSSGPVAFEHKEVLTFDIAVIWDSSSVYPCPAYTNIIEASNCVKDYFDNDVVFTGEQQWVGETSSKNVFPNPAAMGSQIQFNFSNADQFEIFDLTGKKLFAANVKDKTTFNLKSGFLGKGMFVYRILFNDKHTESGKLVIE